ANQAFSEAGAQQGLLGNLMNLYREPSTAEAGFGANLSNLGQGRLTEQQADLNERAARAGAMITQQTTSPMAGIGALGSALTTPIGPGGQTGAGYLGQATGYAGREIGQGASYLGRGIASLYGGGGAPTAAGAYGPMAGGYATGAGAAAADAAVTDLAATEGTAGAGAGIGALLAA